MECLVLGAEGSGKSLLLRRLKWLSQQLYKTKKKIQNFQEVPPAPPTISTVGTNIETLEIDAKRKVKVRELGGAMAPIWANSYEDCCSIVFLVDRSNTTRLAATTMLLLEVLSSDVLQTKSFLLVLNKSDLPNVVSVRETSNIMRLDDMKETCPQHIDITEASCFTGNGVQYILDWIVEHNTK